MIYIIYLSLFIVFLVVGGPAHAQADRYRVEILVLTHLHHGEEPEERNRLADFSESIDFLTPPEEDAADEMGAEAEAAADLEDDAAGVTPAGDIGANLADAPILEIEAEDPATAVVHIEEMSEVMQEAWRRLRLSAPFRPEQYLSWEQSTDEPFPSLRVHDLEVIMIDDPYADLRELLEALQDVEQAGENGERDSVVFGDPSSLVPTEESEDPQLPDPTYFYRLDGSVMLKRSRFLHLDLDLRLREAVFEEHAPARRNLLTAYPGDAKSPQGVAEPPRPSSFLVYRLKQSRQVKTNRLEYFDSPVLGVLAYISAVETEVKPGDEAR